MGSLNHRYVVRTVSYGKEDGLHVLLDELDDQSFLERRDSACAARDQQTYSEVSTEDEEAHSTLRLCTSLPAPRTALIAPSPAQKSDSFHQ